jgi:hypothetical protein
MTQAPGTSGLGKGVDRQHPVTSRLWQVLTVTPGVLRSAAAIQDARVIRDGSLDTGQVWSPVNAIKTIWLPLALAFVA